jgi:hypothetical protein
MGIFALDGNGLLLYHEDGGAAQVFILGEDMDALQALAGRVLYQDYSGCAGYQQATLCSTGRGENFDGETNGEAGGVQAESPAVLVISADDGSQGMDSGADELLAAAGGAYDITLWSTSEDGIPDYDILAGYDAIVVASGDYTGSAPGMDWMTLMGSGAQGFMLIGEQTLDAALYGTQVVELFDLQVANAAHPLALGFTEGQVIPLDDSLSGVPALLLDVGLLGGSEQTQSVFLRGPASSQAGAPILVTTEIDGQRMALAAFSFYRLPAEAQSILAINALAWLTGN